MAGTQRQKAKRTRSRGPSRGDAVNGRPEPTPGEYAREAFAQWGKAARYAAAAIAPVLKTAPPAAKPGKTPLKDRLNPVKTDKGGRLGNVADFLLDKAAGKAGTAASKLGIGSTMAGRLRGEKSGLGPRGDAESNGEPAGHLAIPIQESIDVALPLKAVYELARRFEDYPEFIDRVKDVEWIDDKTAVFEAKVRGVGRSVRVEIAEERQNRRIDWEATDGLDHSGVVTFHELAPSLTHIELTVDLEPDGLIPWLARTIHITQHAIRSDMHRFKAWAELAEDVEEPEEFGEEEGRGEESPEAAGAEEEEEEEPEDYEEEEPEEDEVGDPEGFEEEEELPEDDSDQDFEEPPEEEYDGQNVEYDEEEFAPARAR